MTRPKRSLLAREPQASTSNGKTKENGLDGIVDGLSKSPNVATEAPNKENSDIKGSDEDIKGSKRRNFGLAGLPAGASKLQPEQIHILRQHELFLSRQIEILPATHIRGKCAVVILNEVETCDMYLEEEVCSIGYMIHLAQKRVV